MLFENPDVSVKVYFFSKISQAYLVMFKIFRRFYHDFNQRYIRDEMRYGLDSKCVGEFRVWAIQRTLNRDRFSRSHSDPLSMIM